MVVFSENDLLGLVLKYMGVVLTLLFVDATYL